MINKNYHKGRRKEYRIMKDLRKSGYDIVLRSAGSHSPIDVIGIRAKDSIIMLIQCKPKSMSKRAKKRLEHSLDWLSGTFEVVWGVE